MSRPLLHVGIVGAGLGGLAAAIGIARAGHKVTILEQAPVLGEVSCVPVSCLYSQPNPQLRSAQGFKFHRIRLAFLSDGICLIR